MATLRDYMKIVEDMGTKVLEPESEPNLSTYEQLCLFNSLHDGGEMLYSHDDAYLRLSELGLVKADRTDGQKVWITPTLDGRSMMHKLAAPSFGSAFASKRQNGGRQTRDNLAPPRPRS